MGPTGRTSTVFSRMISRRNRPMQMPAVRLRRRFLREDIKNLRDLQDGSIIIPKGATVNAESYLS